LVPGYDFSDATRDLIRRSWEARAAGT
jgi:hypothetical protein